MKEKFWKQGKVTIQFAILKNGKVTGMKLFANSGDVALDRAAWNGVAASSPLPTLPREFSGQYLGLRMGLSTTPTDGTPEAIRRNIADYNSYRRGSQPSH